MDDFTLEQLLTLEHSGWSSLCNGTGSEYYGTLMTVDALMVLTNGMVMDRSAVVASLSDSPTWDSYEISDPKVVELGEDSAGLVYRARALRSGAEPFAALMTSIYRMVGGEVKLAIYQQTETASGEADDVGN